MKKYKSIIIKILMGILIFFMQYVIAAFALFADSILNINVSTKIVLYIYYILFIFLSLLIVFYISKDKERIKFINFLLIIIITIKCYAVIYQVQTGGNEPYHKVLREVK